LGADFFALVAASRMAFSTEDWSERAPRAMEEAPAEAKEMAMALPMPFEAPQMKTVLPWRLAFLESIAG